MDDTPLNRAIAAVEAMTPEELSAGATHAVLTNHLYLARDNILHVLRSIPQPGPPPEQALPLVKCVHKVPCPDGKVEVMFDGAAVDDHSGFALAPEWAMFFEEGARYSFTARKVQ